MIFFLKILIKDFKIHQTNSFLKIILQNNCLKFLKPNIFDPLQYYTFQSKGDEEFYFLFFIFSFSFLGFCGFEDKEDKNTKPCTFFVF